MKNLSEETIEVGGVEYTLFLNRKGLISWERETKDDQEKIQKFRDKYQNLEDNLEKKTDSDDPFEGLEEIDNFETDTELTVKTYKALYWVMLYTHHKMSRAEVDNWFAKATEEYGMPQLIELGTQMIRDINIDTFGSNTENLKKLKALRPTK